MSDYTSDLNAILDEDLTKVDNSVYHTEIQDEHDALTIDKNTREIIAGSTETLVVGDANSAIKTFVIDRYYDGVDLSEKSIKIVYRRADGEGDINDATDIQVGTNQITFSWVLNYHALFVSGAISFIIEFIGTDEFGEDYILKTKTCTLIPDGDTLSNMDAVSPSQDWVVEIENRISALEEGGTGSGSGSGTGSGSDGYSPIANVVETSTGATITITDKTGTTTASIKNGKDGADGTNGKDGVDGKDGADGEDLTHLYETVDCTSVTSATHELHANTVTYFNGSLTDLTLTFAAATGYCEYNFVFTAGADGCNLSLPSTVIWDGGTAPTLSASTTYEVSIDGMTGIALISSGVAV